MKKKLTIKQLLKLRKRFAETGCVWALQEVNHLIAKYAKKMKVDYYSL